MSKKTTSEDDWPEVIVDDESFRLSIRRLGDALQKAAAKEVDHMGWVDSVKPGQSLSDHLDDKFRDFIDDLPESDLVTPVVEK